MGRISTDKRRSRQLQVHRGTIQRPPFRLQHRSLFYCGIYSAPGILGVGSCFPTLTSSGWGTLFRAAAVKQILRLRASRSAQDDNSLGLLRLM
jgi:hypothetical protein